MNGNGKRSERNLIVAVAGTTLVAAGCALTTSFLIQSVLSAFKDSNSMVLLITANDLRSDDANLERNLNSATEALINCRDISLSLFVGCSMISIALLFRVLRDRSSLENDERTSAR